MDRAHSSAKAKNARRLFVMVYLMIGITAVLAFLCVSHAIPELAKGNLKDLSSSRRGPMRKYTFPTVD
jgi:hypothetical protein